MNLRRGYLTPVVVTAKQRLRTSGVARIIAVAVACAVVFVLRRPDAFFNAQFWAEDGRVFFADDLLLGSWSVVLTPYSGYLHLIPRLVAALADPLPALYVPLVYNASAMVIAALCCSLFASNAYRFLIRSDVIRASLCVLIAAVPFANEIVGSIANVQWYLALAVLLIVIAPVPARLSYRTFASTFVVALFSLSAPQVVVFVPLAAWICAKRRSLAALPCGALLVSVVVQFAVLHSQPEWTAREPLDPVLVAIATAVAFSTRVAMTTIAGHGYAEQLTAAAPAVVAVAAAVVLAVPLFLVRNIRDRRVVSGIATLIMLGAIALAMSFHGAAAGYANIAHIVSWGGERYFFLSSCLLIFLYGVAVDSVRGRTRTYLIAAALFAAAAGALQNARVPALPDDHWAAYVQSIATWRSADAAHLHARRVSVPINPGWQVQLPEEDASGRGTPSKWENRLIQSSGTSAEDDKVYLVHDSRRRWVMHGTWLIEHGYDWPRGINRVSGAELAAIPLGEPIVQEK